ncbi:carbohydrate ABC transporter permease [Helcococcus kunzii]|uniref:carbohydrate ABC transporter permease n=1 Tax=Helcococcus kunzii TaxID=40091 RepID=UPI00201610B3|nr:carbohydrate ABC transporter permease [Helcococcus kunzii]
MTKKNKHLGIKKSNLLSKIFTFSILTVGAILILLPIISMVSTSLKPMEEIMSYPPTLFPKEVKWDNYAKAWNSAPFTRWTLNTAFLTLINTFISVIVNSYIAYGFAKVDFKGKKFLFTLVLSTMLIPGFVTLVPTYVMYSKIGWVNTYLPLIVPSLFGSAFYIFLMRQYYLGIPNELIESAKIDGASHFYIWRKIMLPLTKPSLATVAIFTFKGVWYDFLGPLLYINDESKYNIQIGLQTFRGTVQTQWNYLMAASLISVLPIIILFFVFQKYFIEGSNISSGLKG